MWVEGDKMFDIKQFLMENTVTLNEARPKLLRPVEHELRKAVTDFVWKPERHKIKSIIDLLEKYQDYSEMD